MSRMDQLIWEEIVLELVDMGFNPEEAGRYATDMVQTEKEGFRYGSFD